MSLREQALRVRQQMIRDHAGEWGMDIHQWDWVPGVGVIAMLEHSESDRQPEAMAYLRDWVEKNKEKASRAPVVNAVAPYAVFPALYREYGAEWYRDEAVRVAEWLVAAAPRTREGAFEHTVTENAAFPEQVWADTVFMAVLFLARTASLARRPDFAEEAQRQVLLHLRLLEDEDSGVLFHGWNCGTADHMSAARWTRANAWVAAGVPLILKEIEPLVAVSAELKTRYGRLMEGLVRFQREDGLWSTVMDRPDFYRETSGSAGIGYGLWKAMDAGLIEANDRYRTSAERTLKAVMAQIDESGIVRGVSGGTPVMPSIEAYNEIPTYPTLYGQGLALMLLSEAMRRGISV
ncbi:MULTISPECIES: glycoside hydrolase family 88/105 protein [Cohnella]|uniref:glycoside hydrolase family 88/105 protein n=1 Tax=Cohnella TaxID=329857 RepID=UPI001FE96D22|nr:glycoside hydrolase family 88 protein [Cohnella massiliensis]